MVKIEDSGSRQTFSSGAVRDNEEKINFAEISPWSLMQELLNRRQILGVWNEPKDSDKIWYLNSKEEKKLFIDPSEDPVVDLPEESSEHHALIPKIALERLARHYGLGAAKYDPRNWEKGMPVSRFYASAYRHLIQWVLGDTREDHLAAVLFNIAGIMFVEYHVKKGNLPQEFLDMGPASE